MMNAGNGDGKKKGKIIDLTMEDDDDDDAKMVELVETTNGGNKSDGNCMEFDDEEEMSKMTDEEYDIYLEEKRKELKLFDVFVGKFLGKGWKERGGDPLVVMAKKLMKDKEYAVSCCEFVINFKFI